MKVRVKVRLKGGQCKVLTNIAIPARVCVCVWIVRRKPRGGLVVSVAVWLKQLLLPLEGKLAAPCLWSNAQIVQTNQKCKDNISLLM